MTSVGEGVLRNGPLGEGGAGAFILVVVLRRGRWWSGSCTQDPGKRERERETETETEKKTERGNDRARILCRVPVPPS